MPHRLLLAQQTAVQPERAHHDLPVQGHLARYNIRFLDPQGSVQHLAITSTWRGNGQHRPDGSVCFWHTMIRGIEQTGCKVLEVTTVAEQCLEL